MNLHEFLTISRRGARDSTARAFLRQAKDRPNLTMLLHSRVEKVLISAGRAKGVRVGRFGKAFNVFAKTEVVLSAGPVASPQILMLSGIGPKRQLHSLGIEVKTDLPAGRNLQGHVGHGETFTVKQPISYNPILHAVNPVDYARYFFTGRGPLSSPGGLEKVGFLRTGRNNETWPDIQMLHLALHFGTDLGNCYASIHNLNREQVNLSHT